MFLFRSQDSPSRPFVKAASWRMLGSIDTSSLSWLFTGNAKAAGAIASIQVITKIALYYFHERVWSSMRWGAARGPDSPTDPNMESPSR